MYITIAAKIIDIYSNIVEISMYSPLHIIKFDISLDNFDKLEQKQLNNKK